MFKYFVKIVAFSSLLLFISGFNKTYILCGIYTMTSAVHFPVLQVCHCYFLSIFPNDTILYIQK